MILHKLTRSKIDKFFHSDGASEIMEYAGKEYEKALDKIHDKFMEKFRDWLTDEYSLFFEECVADGIEREVRGLIKGDKDALSRYALAPNSWGIPSDHHKCRRLIVENNQDIIRSTYIQSLEEELARARDSLRWYRENDGH